MLLAFEMGKQEASKFNEKIQLNPRRKGEGQFLVEDARRMARNAKTDLTNRAWNLGFARSLRSVIR